MGHSDHFLWKREIFFKSWKYKTDTDSSATRQISKADTDGLLRDEVRWQTPSLSATRMETKVDSTALFKD